jgi:hypothetical protein
MAMTKDGYKSDLGGLSERGRESADGDLHIVTEGFSGRLALQVVDDDKAFRSVAVSLSENDVLNLIDDLQKWAACRWSTIDLLQSLKGFDAEVNRVLHNAQLHVANHQHGLTSCAMGSVDGLMRGRE